MAVVCRPTSVYVGDFAIAAAVMVVVMEVIVVVFVVLVLVMGLVVIVSFLSCTGPVAGMRIGTVTGTIAETGQGRDTNT